MNFVGVVLAGGRSSRMGQDKAVMRLDGETFLQRAVGALAGAGAARVLVSGSYAGYDCIPDALHAADGAEAIGPLGGIASTLASVPDGAAVFVAVDMPMLDAAVLGHLLDAAHGHGSTRFAGEPLPWIVHVDAHVRAVVAELLGHPSQQRSIRALQTSLGTREIKVPDQFSALLRNVNTPNDWAAFELRTMQASR